MGRAHRVVRLASTLEGAVFACWGTETDVPAERALSWARGRSDVDGQPTACGLRPCATVFSIRLFFPAIMDLLVVIVARNYRAHSERVSRVLGGSRLASFALETVDVDRRPGCL